MTIHIATIDDTITKIAAAFQFDDFQDIYDHPNNADLRDKRPDPNLLVAGDEVHIPQRPDPVTHQLPTDDYHEITVPILRQTLRFRFHPHAEAPYDGLQYELKAGLQTFEGVVNGVIEHQVSAKLHVATLTVFGIGDEAQTVRWTLALGHMDPVETTRGYQARLRNLGFGSDPIDGIHGPKTRAAVRAFQRFADLDIDGIVGPNTQRKLADAYGC